MNTVIGLKPTGYIRVEKWSEKRGTRQDMAFENVVLDLGWETLMDRMLQQRDPGPEYLYLGTGTTTPQRTDTGLEELGDIPGKRISTNHYDGNYDPPNEIYSSITYRFDYGEGEAEGVWTELGLAFGSSYNDPYNRSLFKDDTDTPISLTVLSDEYLRIYVELRIYWPTTEATGTFLFNGDLVDWSAIISSAVSSDSPYGANPWEEGLAKYGEIGENITEGVTNTTDLEARKVTSEVILPPGETVDIERVSFNAQSNDPHIEINFTPHITKTAEEELTGSWSIQYNRAD